VPQRRRYCSPDRCFGCQFRLVRQISIHLFVSPFLFSFISLSSLRLSLLAPPPLSPLSRF
jgi:hypothetical protein